jgi:CAAX protease family protein
MAGDRLPLTRPSPLSIRFPPGSSGGEKSMRIVRGAVLPAFLVILAGILAGHLRGLGAGAMALGMPAILLLFIGYFALGLSEVVGRLRDWCQGSPGRTLGSAQLLPLLYLFYSVPLGCFRLDGFARLLLYVNLPLLALLAAERWGLAAWGDGVALLLVWLPLEFGLVGPLWLWPPGQSGYFLFGILGVVLAVFLFVAVRGWPDVGYTFSMEGKDLRIAVVAFLLFVPVAGGIGLATGFLHPARHLPRVLTTLGKAVGIFLATGVPEELLFRGLLQNLIQRLTSRPALSLALASLVFGAAHLNNGAHPDGRYFFLATLAGLAYGWAYRRSGKLVAPALTHTLVDTAWMVFFRG